MRGLTKLLTGSNVVELHHYAVNLILEIVAARLKFLVVLENALNGVDSSWKVVDWQTQCSKPLKYLPLFSGRAPFQSKDVIHIDVERSGGGHARVTSTPFRT